MFNGDVKGQEERLGKHLAKVYEIMEDGNWRTLPTIQTLMGGRVTTQSISARLRDLRKKKFGGYLVESRHIGGGLFAYRLDIHRKNNPKVKETEELTVEVKVWKCGSRYFLTQKEAKDHQKMFAMTLDIIEGTRTAVRA